MSEVKGTLQLQRKDEGILVDTGIEMKARQTVNGRSYIPSSGKIVDPEKLPQFLKDIGMTGGDYSSLLGPEPTADMVGVWFQTTGETLVKLGLLLPDCPN